MGRIEEVRGVASSRKVTVFSVFGGGVGPVDDCKGEANIMVSGKVGDDLRKLSVEQSDWSVEYSREGGMILWISYE